ncbi:MAG: MFS transporter [Desulfobacterales bacterium]|nr:MFS transporter [Desulfobacterales bacterium]
MAAMHTRRLLIIVLIFVGLTQLFYMVSNAAMFRSEYQRQNLEQMEELGQIIKKEVEFALDLGLPLGSIGGMDTFLSSVLETAPELSHIHVASGSVVLFSAHRAMDAVQDIRIPILSQDRQVGEIRLGLGDALGKRTYTLLFDLLTIVMAGLIITYEVIRFFGSRLMVIPLKQSKENINAMVRDLTPVPPMRMPVEFTPFITRLGQAIQHRRGEVSRLRAHLNQLKMEIYFRVFHGRGALVAAVDQQAASLMPDRGGKIRRMVDPSQIRPIVFLFFLGANLQASFLPLFSRELLEKPTFLTGFFSHEILMGLPITCYMMTVFAFMLFMGSDLFKRWVNMDHAIGLGAMCTTLGLICGGLSQDIVQLIAGRMLTAVGFAFIVIYCKQFIVEHASVENRSLHLAGFTAAFSGGLFCSVIIGSVLVEYFSYRFVFFASAAIVLVIYAFDYMIRDDKVSLSTDKAPEKGGGLGLFFKAGSRDVNLVCIFIHGIFTRITFIGFFYFSLPIFLKADFLYADIGRIMMFYSLPSVLFAGYLNKRLKQIRQSKFSVVGSNVLVGLVFMGFYFLGEASPTLKAAYVIFSLLVLGISNSVTFPAQSSLLMHTRTAKEIGSRTTLSVYSSFERIGSSLGPVFYGYFAARADIGHAIVMGGALCILGNVIFSCFFRSKTP